MPGPTSTEQLFEHLAKSGLIPSDRLEQVVADTPADQSPKATLAKLTEMGLLTPFHADRIQAGKHKGFLLGGYVILDKLGGGGMGQVYLAEHTAMRRHVALKVLPIESANNEVARERFLREARAAAGLNHPNIIRVHDLRKEGHVLYLVMEFVEGNSLSEYVGRGGKVDVPAAADYARQVAFGLQHAHENGLVHRDIKPANLHLSRDGRVRILDLGLVRSEADADSKLTSKINNSILGTADYLAPEQAVNSSAVDIRADIYSLGATLYHLLAGRPMFPEGRTAQKLMWQQTNDPKPIRELRPEVPPRLAEVLAKAIQKKPEDRFQTPQEFADALAPWAELNTTLPNPVLMPPPPPRWLSAKPVATMSSMRMAAVRSGSGTGTSSGDWKLPSTPSVAEFGMMLGTDSSYAMQVVSKEALSPTMQSQPTITPRVLVPPARRSSTGSAVRPAVRPAQRGSAVMAVSFIAIGFLACLLTVWLVGQFK